MILLYGAPIWSEALRVKAYRQKIERVQRKAALRIASAYQTVSLRALQVVFGVIPIHIQVDERRRQYNRENGHLEINRRAERKISLVKWQEEWQSNETDGQWTKILILDIRRWYNCPHREIYYFLSHVLTGHGSYKTYTKRIGKSEEEDCIVAKLIRQNIQSVGEISATNKYTNRGSAKSREYPKNHYSR